VISSSVCDIIVNVFVLIILWSYLPILCKLLLMLLIILKLLALMFIIWKLCQNVKQMAAAQELAVEGSVADSATVVLLQVAIATGCSTRAGCGGLGYSCLAASCHSNRMQHKRWLWRAQWRTRLQLSCCKLP